MAVSAPAVISQNVLLSRLKKSREEIDLKIGGGGKKTHAYTKTDQHIPFQSTDTHKMSNKLESLAWRD